MPTSDAAPEPHDVLPADVALPIGSRIVQRLRALPEVERAQLAGSLRRGADTVGDIDVLIGVADSAAAPGGTLPLHIIQEWEAIDHIIESGSTKMSILIDRVQVDFRQVQLDHYGAALQYFTGSAEHNIALRRRAKDRGLKLSEYGLFDQTVVSESPDNAIAAEEESAVYDALLLDYPPPELRDDDLSRWARDDE